MITKQTEEELIINDGQIMGNSPAVLVWQNISVVSKKEGKQLLKPMNGKITGGFWAVMGPSGSGKSTLLNALSCRLDRAVTRTGECRFNGRKYTNRELKAMSCYVMQEDVLNAYFTVYETLIFTARMRMARGTNEEKLKLRVEEVIRNMELGHTRNTIVGNSLIKGISGGEKKRLCIAMELITHPKLLFLDEPTSGLDSVTALIVCQKLKELGQSGRCTVVSTIHQPQSKIFSLFDSLILLTKGNIVYQGACGQPVLDFFEKTGYVCPPLTNPADFLMDVISSVKTSDSDIVVNTTYELESAQKLGKIDKGKPKYYIPQDKDFMNGLTVDLDMGLDKKFTKKKAHISWCLQFWILMRRNMKEYARKYRMVLTQILSTIVMAVIIGTVFLQIGHDQTSVPKRSASLFFCCINQGIFVALQSVNSFPAERQLSLRERKAGTYNISAYYLSKVISDFLTKLINPLVFSVIVYSLIGFQRSAEKFIIFFLFMILTGQSTAALTNMVTTLCKTADLSVTVLPFAMELTRIYGGFFLSPALLPKYFMWIDALSYIKYAYIGVSLNELTDLKLHCAEGQLNKYGVCPIVNGDFTIEQLGLDYITLEGAALSLVGFILVTRFISFLGIRFLKD
jgi:ABC-type multidrug transport system ATPase subunit